jgi:hypothetical protein
MKVKTKREGYLTTETTIRDPQNLHKGILCWFAGFRFTGHSFNEVCDRPCWESYRCRRCNVEKIINRTSNEET